MVGVSDTGISGGAPAALAPTARRHAGGCGVGGSASGCSIGGCGVGCGGRGHAEREAERRGAGRGTNRQRTGSRRPRWYWSVAAAHARSLEGSALSEAVSAGSVDKGERCRREEEEEEEEEDCANEVVSLLLPAGVAPGACRDQHAWGEILVSPLPAARWRRSATAPHRVLVTSGRSWAVAAATALRRSRAPPPPSPPQGVVLCCRCGCYGAGPGLAAGAAAGAAGDDGAGRCAAAVP